MVYAGSSYHLRRKKAANQRNQNNNIDDNMLDDNCPRVSSPSESMASTDSSATKQRCQIFLARQDLVSTILDLLIRLISLLIYYTLFIVSSLRCSSVREVLVYPNKSFCSLDTCLISHGYKLL